MNAIAHIRKPDGREQPLKEHLEHVAAIASEFMGADHLLCSLVGRYHDIGKATSKFQEYIHGKRKVGGSHSPYGAKLLLDRMDAATRDQAFAAALCIAGHHGGLRDAASPEDLAKQLKSADTMSIMDILPPSLQNPSLPSTQDLPIFENFASAPRGTEEEIGAYNFAFMAYIRQLFSSLVDADYLDTEAFMNGKDIRRFPVSLKDLEPSILRKEASYRHPTSAINKRRTEILQDCISAAENLNNSLFSLTVATGGGKTFASLAFALHLALRHQMKRIVYIIPYTSITEQTAKDFREIVGEDIVLEHQYQASWMLRDAQDKNAPPSWQQLASENWDAPLIVTTNNQFFESLFSNRPSVCRKLHNIQGSVLIFDEAQMLPMHLLKPSMNAVNELVEHYGCRAVFCTATQPILSEFFHNPIQEIAVKSDKDEEIFHRCTYVREASSVTPTAIAERMAQQKQCLVIFNFKKGASEVFAELPKDSRFYLSTNLYPVHRKRVIETIRERLSKGLPCHVVSTSLIEAGVDLDFPCVWREFAGLDHIIQAAGRCNRNHYWRAEDCFVHVFEMEPVPKGREDLEREIGQTKEVWEEFPDAIDSPEAIRMYFRMRLHEAMDCADIMKTVCYGLPFSTVAQDYRLIDAKTYPVFIYQNEPGDLGERLKDIKEKMTTGYGTVTRDELRLVRQYSVNVYNHLREQLFDHGKLDLAQSKDYAILLDKNCYDDQLGLILNDMPSIDDMLC